MVSHDKVRTFGDGDIHIVALDCGMKENIIRCLLEKNAKVTVVPYDYDFRQKCTQFYRKFYIHVE